jgi:hypothetical protein
MCRDATLALFKILAAQPIFLILRIYDLDYIPYHFVLGPFYSSSCIIYFLAFFSKCMFCVLFGLAADDTTSPQARSGAENPLLQIARARRR